MAGVHVRANCTADKQTLKIWGVFQEIVCWRLVIQGHPLTGFVCVSSGQFACTLFCVFGV